ncbi:alpha/beta hydrolase [Actinomyces viscosus]|nr:alpha/beta hydrolase [Actinomyces viscosus]TFH52671.1 alpha/beta hydrolase [Actinomyces viscosus]
MVSSVVGRGGHFARGVSARRRVSAGVLAAVAGVCLGVGAGVVPAAAAPVVPAGAAVPAGLESFYNQKVEWYDCGATGGMERSAEATAFKCAKVKVPLDYSKPEGETIEIAMKKHVATGSVRQGSLFINPGGPGYSGVEMVESNETQFSPDLNASFDIIGFDPRGVGASTPITCDVVGGALPAGAAQAAMGVNDPLPGSLAADAAGADPTPFQDAQDPAADGAAQGDISFQTLIDEITKDFKQEEAQCAASTKPAGLLDHVDTVSVARDLDVLRALSGDDKLNYLGFSYGTYLGAHYAELFPANTGRMVLDGALDPSLSLAERASGQAAGFESSLRTYVEQCQAGQAVQAGQSCPLTGDTDAGVQQIRDLIAAADQTPLKTSDPNTTVDGSTIRVVVRRLMYSSEYWSFLTYALDQAITQNDGSYLQALYGPATAGSSAPTYYAVNCLDIPVQGDMASWEKEYQQNIQTSPTFGASLSNQDARCRAWGHNATRQPAPIHAKGAAPILVVGTTGDPATPYAWSEALAEQLESGRLLTWEGNGHTAYGRSSSCIHSAVDGYLINGKVPEPGATCKGGE